MGMCATLGEVLGTVIQKRAMTQVCFVLVPAGLRQLATAGSIWALLLNNSRHNPTQIHQITGQRQSTDKQNKCTI